MLWQLWGINKPIYRAILFVLSVAACVGISHTLFLLFSNNDGGTVFRAQSTARLVVASIIFLIIQYALKTQENISRLLIEKEQIQKENYRVQLKALRKTVDPHFLFNSLNTLRSMVRQQHENAETFVMSLSDFYRQVLKYNENQSLSLKEELTVLESYLFLMKSRNEKAVSLTINVDEAFHGLHLPSLALQVVVENCFKHNAMTAKMPLRIEVNSTEEGYIQVTNNLQPKIEEDTSSGFGLDNLRKRYELMGASEGVIVNKCKTHFKVLLRLLKK
jgi:LytS/YehU family sensor histidine kinase